jgi:type I restriction enzyme, S subunit
MIEWSIKSVGDLATFHRGITWASSQETEEPEPECVPVLRIPNVQQRLDTTSILFLRGISLEQRTRFAATMNWLLMVGSNGNPNRVGDCVRITQDTDFLFASFLVGVEPKSDKSVDPCFLQYLLRSDSVRKAVSDSIKGTTGLRNISLSHLAAHELRCPAPVEQRKIARILTTLDNLIEKTEALIAKYQAIKQGMMHDLFTRGIDAHGHLRPTPAEAPDLYKHSAPGWIPREWECMSFGTYILSGPQNGLYKPLSAYSDDGFPIVRIDGFYDGALCDSNTFRRLKLTSTELALYCIAEDDILVNRVNSIDFVGKSAIVNHLAEPTVMGSSPKRVGNFGPFFSWTSR